MGRIGIVLPSGRITAIPGVYPPGGGGLPIGADTITGGTPPPPPPPATPAIRVDYNRVNGGVSYASFYAYLTNIPHEVVEIHLTDSYNGEETHESLTPYGTGMFNPLTIQPWAQGDHSAVGVMSWIDAASWWHAVHPVGSHQITAELLGPEGEQICTLSTTYDLEDGGDFHIANFSTDRSMLLRSVNYNNSDFNDIGLLIGGDLGAYAFTDVSVDPRLGYPIPTPVQNCIRPLSMSGVSTDGSLTIHPNSWGFPLFYNYGFYYYNDVSSTSETPFGDNDSVTFSVTDGSSVKSAAAKLAFYSGIATAAMALQVQPNAPTSFQFFLITTRSDDFSSVAFSLGGDAASSGWTFAVTDKTTQEDLGPLNSLVFSGSLYRILKVDAIPPLSYDTNQDATLTITVTGAGGNESSVSSNVFDITIPAGWQGL